MICSQWHPLADLRIDQAHMNITKVDHTRLDTDSAFSLLCMTAVYEVKWIASTKKARPSLAQPP